MQVPRPPEASFRECTQNLRQHAEILSAFVNDYNQILVTMIPEELTVLQRQHGNVEKFITKCISSDAAQVPMNWRSHGVATFLKRMQSALRSLASGVEALRSNSELIRKTAKMWYDFPLFDRKILGSALHESQHLQAEETKLRVDKALSALRKLLGDSLGDIAEKLKVSASKVGVNTTSVEWQQYGQYCDHAVQTGLQQAYVKSLRDLHNAVSGDHYQDGLPSTPIMEIKLELAVGVVHFTPLVFGASTAAHTRGMVRAWAAATSEVYNGAFAAAAAGTSTEALGATSDVARLLIAIEQAEIECAKGRADFLKQFTKLSCLWEDDMATQFATFMHESGEQSRRAAASCDRDYFPSLHKFEEQINHFRELADTVEELPSFATVKYIRIDARPIKQTMTSWATKWSSMFESFLANSVNVQIKVTQELVQDIEAELNVKVEHDADDDILTGVVTAILHVEEAAQTIGAVFRPIQDTILMLKELGVPLGDNVTSLAFRTETRWNQALCMCEDVKNLHERRVRARSRRVAEVTVRLVDEMQEWRQQLQKDAPAKFTLELANRTDSSISVLDERSHAALQVGLATYDHRTRQYKTAYAGLQKLIEVFDDYKAQLKSLQKETKMFQQPPPNMDVLHSCRIDILRLKRAWDTISMVTMTLDYWSCVNWADKRECCIDRMLDISKSLLIEVESAQLDEWFGFASVAIWIKSFHAALKVLERVHQSHMVRRRHWRSLVKHVISLGVCPTTAMVQYCERDNVPLQLGDILSLQPHVLCCAKAFNDMLSKAQGEFELDKKLSVLTRYYEELELTIFIRTSEADPTGTTPTLAQMHRIERMEGIFTKLSEHETDVSAMQFSNYLEFFRATVGLWSQRLRSITTQLTLIAELDNAIEAMGQWYLEQPRVRLDLEDDARMFELLFLQWQRFVVDLAKEPNVLAACSPPERLESLKQMQETMEQCQVALEGWVECIRSTFPRLYFLSSAELLSTTVRSAPTSSLLYLPKLFAGVRRIQFDPHETEVVGVATSNGFTLPLQHNVSCSQDGWLGALLCELQQIVRHLLAESFFADTESKHVQLPQVAALEAEIVLARSVDAAMQSTMDGNCEALHQLKGQRSDKMASLVLQLRSERGTTQASVDSIKMQLLCELRHRDVLDNVSQMDMQEAVWLWQSQPRYYHLAGSDGDLAEGQLVVKVLRAEFVYSYELLPVSVYCQPLTDRSFITMATVINSVHGASLCGPTGAGKTQSVVAFGYSLGRMVYSLGCHSIMHPHTMACIFKGIAHAGVWCCFDFGDVAQSGATSTVLLAQHLGCLLSGIQARAETIDIGGDVIPLSPLGGFFVTRTVLTEHVPIPVELRSWLRPVSINLVNQRTLCECMLMAAGSGHHRIVGQQLALLFELCSDCLCESVYDWSTRALFKIIDACDFEPGSLLDEQQRIVSALVTTISPRLHPEDRDMLWCLVMDVFGHKSLSYPHNCTLLNSADTATDDTIARGVHKYCQLAQMHKSDDLHRNTRQLDDLFRRSTAVVLVGNTGSGKSTVWKALATANDATFDVLCPSSTSACLISHTDPDANGARQEGPLTKILQRMVAEARRDMCPKLVVLDDHLDLRWMETLHGVTDESNQLYLPSSNGSVALDGLIQLLFECDSLANASPASISRVAVLPLRESEPSWRLAASSWLSHVRSPVAQKRLQQMFDTYLECLVKQIEHRRSEDRAVALAAVNMACSLLATLLLTTSMELADSVAATMNMAYPPSSANTGTSRSVIERVDAVFNFTAVWSFGGSILLSSERRTFDAWWRSTWQGTAMPDKATVFDFYMDTQGNFVPWSSFVPRTSQGTVDLRSYCIPNDATTSILVIYELLLQQQRPVMLAGNHGVGKTCIVRSLSSSFQNRDFVYTPCNHATTSLRLINAFLEQMSWKNGVLRPTYSTEADIVFVIDDVTAPKPDAYGGQSVAALLRHLFEYRQVNLAGKNTPVRGAQYVAVSGSVQTPGTRPCNRIKRHFATLGVVSLTEAELVSLFEPVVTRQFTSAGTKHTASSLVHATVALHCEISAVLRAVAGSSISSVCHGLCRVQDFSTRSLSLVQLWLHECRRTYRDRLCSPEDMKAYDAACAQICKLHLDSNLNLQRARQQQMLLVPINVQNNSSAVSPLAAMTADDVRELVTRQISASTSDQQLDRSVDHSKTFVVEALEHICRAARSLSVPSGHIIITGERGSGKYTSGVLAARLCGYDRIVDLTGFARHSEGDFTNELRKVCMAAGIGHAAGYVCLLTGDLPDYALGLIDNVIATGSVYGQFDQADAAQILAAMQTELSQQGLVVGPKECWRHFRANVQQNVHFIITSTRAESTWSRFPSLWRRSGVNFVPMWSAESLYEMAFSLMQSDRLNLNTAHAEAVAQSFVRGHLASVEASRTLAQQGRYIPVAPDTLRDCIKLCEDLVVQRRMEIGEYRQNTRVVLQNITRLETTIIAGMKTKLVAAKADEREKVAAVDEIIEKVGAETDRLQEQTSLLQDHKRLAEPLIAKAGEVKAAVDALKAQISSAQSDRKASASELRRTHLAELLRPRRQQSEIVDVAASVLTLMNTSGSKLDTSWKHMKTVISDAQFRQSLVEFNAHDVTDSSLVAAQIYLEEPYFNADYLQTKCQSNPAAILCKWVTAIVVECLASRKLESQTNSLAKAEQAAADSAVKQNSLEIHVASIAERLEVLKKEFDFVSSERVAAAELVHNIGDRIAIAAQVVRCLSEPAKQWHIRDKVLSSLPLENGDADVERARFERFDSDNTGLLERAEIHAMMTEMGVECDPEYLNAVLTKFDVDGDGSVDLQEFRKMWKHMEAESTFNLVQPETPDYTIGDAVVAAVHVTYMAAFGPYGLRVELRDLWLAELDHREVIYSKKQEWWTILQPAVRPLEWVRCGIPGDQVAIESAVAALHSSRIPLLIDPEGQAEDWLAKLYGIGGLRVVHCEDDDVVSQISRSHTTSLVIQIDDSMSTRGTSELVRGLRLHCQRAGQHARLFLHCRSSNLPVPAAIAPLCTIVCFGSSAASIKDRALRAVVSMSLSDEQAASSSSAKTALELLNAEAIEQEKLHLLLQLVRKVEPDNEHLFASENAVINAVGIATEEWHKAADVCRATTVYVRAAEIVRAEYEPLAHRTTIIYSCCQRIGGGLACTAGDAAVFGDAVCKSISDCWEDSTGVPTVEVVTSATVKSILRWIQLQAKPLDFLLLLGLLCMQESRHSTRDLPDPLLSPQLQPNEFAEALSRVICNHLGREIADGLELTKTPSNIGAIQLATCFRDNLRQALSHCNSCLVSAESSAVEENILRCCWLHSVLATRASLGGTCVYYVEFLDAIIDAAQVYANEPDNDAIMKQIVSLSYTAGLASQWDRRTCTAYVNEIMGTGGPLKDENSTKEGASIMLPNLPVSRSELRMVIESGGVVTGCYLEAITTNREIESSQGLLQLLGVTNSELNGWIEDAERATMDRWRTINKIVPPRVGDVEQRATAKSRLDEILLELPPPLADNDCIFPSLQEQHPIWPVATAVRREMARYERTRSRAESMLKNLDRALEAASGVGPPVHPRLQVLAQALAMYTVPDEWFHDQILEGENISDEPESRVNNRAFAMPVSRSSSGCVKVRSVHEWTGMMQACLSQLTRWQAALKTRVDTSGVVWSTDAALFKVNLRAVFRPREFLTACRLAIARQRGWALAQASWTAEVHKPGWASSDNDGPHQPMGTIADDGSSCEDECVTVVGLQLHGATWGEKEGLSRFAENDYNSSITAVTDMPPVHFRLMQGESHDLDANPDVHYECPVFKHGATQDYVFTVKLQAAQSVRRWETRGVSLVC